MRSIFCQRLEWGEHQTECDKARTVALLHDVCAAVHGGLGLGNGGDGLLPAETHCSHYPVRELQTMGTVCLLKEEPFFW